jgi:hypothetical protein
MKHRWLSTLRAFAKKDFPFWKVFLLAIILSAVAAVVAAILFPVVRHFRGLSDDRRAGDYPGEVAARKNIHAASGSRIC